MARTRPSRTEAIVSRLPASIAYRIDLRRPRLKDGYGGAFNGQQMRQQAVRDMFERVPFDLVVETGTYRGTTTAFLRTLTTAPIVTVESSVRLERYSRARLADLPNIKVRGGDSASEIRRIRHGKRAVTVQRPFFYLDAHGGPTRRLPLRYELLEVTSAWPEFCVLIDDFQVPGDPGYGFDSFGVGFRLQPAFLDGLDLTDVVRFWPSAPSSAETGKRRGWLVLARGDEMVAAMRAIGGLREEAA